MFSYLFVKDQSNQEQVEAFTQEAQGETVAKIIVTNQT